MTHYYADLNRDLPVAYKPKRIVFYARGLKVYGLLPYILQRKLHAQFFSSTIAVGGGWRLYGHSAEENWTAVPYRQSPEACAALLDWLYGDKGFEVAIAGPENWHDDIFDGNFWQDPPEVWFPAGQEARPGFVRVLGGEAQRLQEITALLALPTPKEGA